MKWLQIFTSAVGKKIVMALTGIFLISFLIVHVALNSCIFNDLFLNPDDNGSMFNRAAFFMGNSLVIRIMEIGLFLGIILHIVQGYLVEAQNRTKRKNGYKINLGNRGSTWMSRSMALLGTLIFLFLIVHISKFWWASRITHDMDAVTYNGVEMHNVFMRMYEVFQNPLIVALYVAGVLSLGFHLWHGFHSAFRSIGVHNKKYLAMLKVLGYGYTIIVSLLFLFMPLSMYLQWVSPYN